MISYSIMSYSFLHLSYACELSLSLQLLWESPRTPTIGGLTSKSGSVSAGTVGNFNLSQTERIGDYSASYNIGLDALSVAPLSGSDRTLLSPYRKSFFV